MEKCGIRRCKVDVERRGVEGRSESRQWVRGMSQSMVEIRDCTWIVIIKYNTMQRKRERSTVTQAFRGSAGEGDGSLRTRNLLRTQPGNDSKLRSHIWHHRCEYMKAAQSGLTKWRVMEGF